MTYTKTGVSAGTTYKFKVQARNAAGFGTESAEFSIIAATIPGVVTAITRDEVNTSKTQVAFTWTAPTSTGGSAVIDYTIMWDQGTGTYIQVAAGVTTTSYTKTGLTAGTTYNFKVQARNVIGVGSLTSAFSIVAAVVPSVPTTLTRDNVNTSKTQVAFIWSAPTDNGGVAVIDYSI